MSFSWWSSTWAAVGAIAVLAYILYRAALPKPIPGIPYHKKSAQSLLGDMPALMEHVKKTDQVFDWMSAQCEELDSPIIQLFLAPLSRPTVILTDFREAQDILMRRPKDFDRSKFFADIFAGILTNHTMRMPTNEHYKRQSRLLAETMQPKFLDDVASDHLHRSMRGLVNLWRRKSALADGHPFEAGDNISQMALDAIWAAATGKDIATLDLQTQFLSDKSATRLPTDPDLAVEFPEPTLSQSYRAIIAIAHSMEIVLKSPFPKAAHWWLRQGREYRSAKAHKDRLIIECLADAKRRVLDNEESDTHIRCAGDCMIAKEQQMALKENRKPDYDSKGPQDELFGFFVGGFDTTSTTLKWGVKNLSDYPEVQTKLRQAVRAAIKQPTARAIAKTSIPYLDAFVEETLRLAVVAPGQQRVAIRDTTVLGHVIPKGTDIHCNSNAYTVLKPQPWAPIDENKRSVSSREAKGRTGEWDTDDIGSFKPERWLKTNETGVLEYDGRAGPNSPFGAGVRGCFGKKLAYLEMKMVYALLVWNFELQGCGPILSTHKPRQVMMLTPDKCYVRLKILQEGYDSMISTC